MSRRKCIVCGKPIRKRTNYVRFETPVTYRAATTKVLMGREIPDLGERAEKPEGHRDVDILGNVIYYTSNPPKTKAECQRFTNAAVLSVRRHWSDPDTIHEFSFWDGETYEDEFFHSGDCAKKQGYAAARAGHRWKWS
jgi:hypothetical protein